MSAATAIIKIAPSPEALAQLFADFLTKRIAEKAGTFTLALSGGSTPQRLFSLLSKAPYTTQIDWAKVQLFWGDERLLPHDHPDSNYGVAKRLLLDHIDMPAENIHPVATHMLGDTEAILADYNQQIAQCVATDEQGRYRFDLIMLGMGDDGHTASIFPHEMALLDSSALTAIATHPDSGQQRLTLTGPLIRQAAEVVFLVAGANKAPKIDQILGKKDGYKTYPAAHVGPENGELYWFLDQAAMAY